LRVVTAAEMKSIDHKASQAYGIPSIILMENAGIAVCRAALDMLRFPQGKVVLVVAGRGNNGGDGFVAARHLYLAGAKVKVVMVADPDSMIGDARVNFDIWLRLGQKVYDLQDRNGMQVLQLALMQSDLIVDAIYGTGFRGALKDKVRRTVELINESGKPVLAVDIPSGVEADTGKVNGLCVRATRTVTFGLPKPGLVLDPGASFAGEVQVAGISLPPDLLSDGGTRFLLTRRLVRQWLNPRAADAHKGQFGHVLVVAGSRGMTGAACLAGKAALRAGAGLVTIALPESQQPVVASRVVEAMTLPLPETPDGTLAFAAKEQLLDRAARCSTVALGPGLSTHPETQELAREVVLNSTVPCVLDADGLNAFAGTAERLKYARGPLVITPHSGEMARLLGTSAQKVQSERLAIAEQTARDWDCVTVLKGARTIAAGAAGTFINPSGNPGMATGGSGDVLTGVIAGLLAQGLDPLHAAAAGVFVHGTAGDAACRDKGQRGLIAGDIIRMLPEVLKQLESETMEV